MCLCVCMWSVCVCVCVCLCVTRKQISQLASSKGHLFSCCDLYHVVHISLIRRESNNASLCFIIFCCPDFLVLKIMTCLYLCTYPPQPQTPSSSREQCLCHGPVRHTRERTWPFTLSVPWPTCLAGCTSRATSLTSWPTRPAWGPTHVTARRGQGTHVPLEGRWEWW